jgi:hypothetical protein
LSTDQAEESRKGENHSGFSVCKTQVKLTVAKALAEAQRRRRNYEATEGAALRAR